MNSYLRHKFHTRNHVILIRGTLNNCESESVLKICPSLSVGASHFCLPIHDETLLNVGHLGFPLARVSFSPDEWHEESHEWHERQ